MSYNYLKFDMEDGIGTITLNRPEKRNALSLELLKELNDLLSSMSENGEVRVVIIKGEGKVFCAGHDIAQLVDHEMTFYRKIFGICWEIMEKIQRKVPSSERRVLRLGSSAPHPGFPLYGP
jgi:enoyl-CoA hydratase/carnithine racemase